MPSDKTIPLISVEFPKDSNPPILKTGDMNPKILYCWERAAHCHFRYVGLADELHVATIASCMEDSRMKDCQQGDRVFWEWVTELRTRIIYLNGTPHTFDEHWLCDHIFASNAPTLNGTVGLEQWLQAIKRLNEERRESEAWVRKTIEQAIVKVRNRTLAPLNANINHTSTKQSLSGPSTQMDKIPHLGDEEQSLSSKYEGCYKCCRVL
ncbi:hypothetical protein OBBRIDRAFT_808523 [Obba rivulosa]|uniref:Uncharacterized protein n=1 Tax=Obba rivulosa TaxID=1052685 RepID=A0A8E2AGH8_9APHY|nr:hypothetical protein OBBRIDRAFT_808523 [Obba rivulosa]